MPPRYYFIPPYTLHHNNDPPNVLYEFHNVSPVFQFNSTQNAAWTNGVSTHKPSLLFYMSNIVRRIFKHIWRLPCIWERGIGYEISEHCQCRRRYYKQFIHGPTLKRMRLPANNLAVCFNVMYFWRLSQF
jgi:hypothetical protein